MSDVPLRDPCPADRRRLASPSGTAALEHARAEIRHANEHDVLLGKLLAQVERDRSYVAEGCSSAQHWAEMNGLDRGRAASLIGAGRSFAVLPDAARAVLDGEVTPQAAGVVGRLVPSTPMLPPAVQPDPQQQAAQDAAVADRARAFLDHAKTTPTHRLVRDVNAENERVKQGERVVPLHFDVKEGVRDGWRLAKKIACRRAGRALTEGEAFALVTDDFLLRHDRDNLSGRKQPRERRMGPTSERPDDRVIAAEVRREVKARSKGHCEFPGCSNGTFLQLCHLVAHRDRGDREAGNFVDLCTQHHTMLDKGLIRFFARTERGVSFVLMSTGEVIDPDPRRDNADVLPVAPLPADECGGAGAGLGPPSDTVSSAVSDCSGARAPSDPAVEPGPTAVRSDAGPSRPDPRGRGPSIEGGQCGDGDIWDGQRGDGQRGDRVAERPPPWGGGATPPTCQRSERPRHSRVRQRLHRSRG